MSNAQKKLCCKHLSWDQKKEKMKTGSEYLYYIPREITLSLYDCEPLQWTLRGVIKYIWIVIKCICTDQHYIWQDKNRLVNNKPLFKILKKIIFQIHSAILIYLFLKYFHEKKNLQYITYVKTCLYAVYSKINLKT